MGYSKNVWVNGGSPAINAINLGKMETGIEQASYAGEIKYFLRKTAPTGYLKADGSAVSRTTYADLFNEICPSQNFTVTIASPAVFSAIEHGLSSGDPVRFTTTGALPTGLSTSTTYYVISAGLTADAFQVSTSVGGAAVNTSGSQSGNHSLRPFYYGIGDGSTTFNLPDLRGVFVRGYDDGKGYDANRVFGSYQADDNKAHTHTGTTASSGDHNHTISPMGNPSSQGAKINYGNSVDAQSFSTNTGNAGTHTHTFTTDSTGATEVKVKNIALLACIRY